MLTCVFDRLDFARLWLNEEWFSSIRTKHEVSLIAMRDTV